MADSKYGHPTTNLVGFPIDVGIFPLVAALNTIPGIHTVSSCQAYPLANNNAWVCFKVLPLERADTQAAADARALEVLRRLHATLTAADVHIRQFSVAVESGFPLLFATLEISPDDVEIAADAILPLPGAKEES